MTALLCLPGLLCTQAVFGPALATAGVAALRPELPDEGDFADIAGQLAAMLPERTVILGHSMGSYLAYHLHRLAAPRIAGLVLVSTTARADTPKAAALRDRVVGWARQNGIDALAKTVADTTLGKAALTNAALRAEMVEMARAVGLDTFSRHQAALAGRPDYTGDLARIACPVRVLTGEDDRVTPPDAGREVAAAVPGGRFELVAGAGHMLPLENPDAVAAALDAALVEASAEAAR